MNINIKKNILDLEYNKNLQYYNTVIIIISTYIVGVMISLITKQVDYTSLKDFSILSVISSFFIIVNVIFLMKFKERLNKIIEEIKDLN
ncbi:MAG: hypothetical protein AABX19_03125 [Nanoarchaeota archaeon]